MEAPTIKVKGVDYVMPTSFTLDELVVFKENGGFTLTTIFDALEDADAEAWRVMLYIIRSRAGDDVTLAECGGIDFVVDVEFQASDLATIEEEVVPPGEAARDAAAPNEPSGSQETTPVDAGRLVSVPHGDSSLGRWAV